MLSKKNPPFQKVDFYALYICIGEIYPFITPLEITIFWISEVPS